MRTRLDKAGFGLTFGSFGPLALFAPKGMWIPILLLLLIRSKRLTSIEPRDYWKIFSRNSLYLILPVYAALSAVWALVPENEAVITGAKLAGYIMAAIVVVVVVDLLSDSERRSALIWVAAGLIIADLFVWLDIGTAGALSNLFRHLPFSAHQYSDGAAVSACVVLPASIGLFRVGGLKLALVFAGISVATVFVLENEAAKLSAIFGILVYIAVWWRGVLFWPVILLPLATGIIFPFFFVNGLSDNLLCTFYDNKPSAAHRLMIYEYSSRSIFQRPILGWGMDASRSIPGGGEEAQIIICTDKTGLPKTRNIGELMPLHPHNASLQVWLELGAVGVVIFVGLLSVLIVRWQRSYAAVDGRPLIASLFGVIFLVYNISFGLWQGWLIFALIMLCAIVRVLRLSGLESRSE